MEEVRLYEPVYHLMLLGDFLAVIFVFLLIFWIADNIRACRETAAKWNKSIRKRSQRLSSKQLWTCSTETEEDPPNKIVISRGSSESDSTTSTRHNDVPHEMQRRNMSVASERSTTSAISYNPNQRVSLDSFSQQSSGQIVESTGSSGRQQKKTKKTSLPDLFVQLSGPQLEELVEEKKNRDNLIASQGSHVDPDLVFRRLEVLPEMSEQSSIQSNLVLNFPVPSRVRE